MSVANTFVSNSTPNVFYIFRCPISNSSHFFYSCNSYFRSAKVITKKIRTSLLSNHRMSDVFMLNDFKNLLWFSYDPFPFPLYFSQLFTRVH